MIRAKIVGILTKDDVSLFELKGLNLEANLFMLVLNEASKFALDDEIDLGFKSSDVILSKDKLSNSSLENELKCVIEAINFGEILSVVSLKCGEIYFEAIISNHALKTMNIGENDEVFAYIKSTSIHISTQK
ncbi:TOBE domain-containing protein [Campylobacter concisus]|jgi:molybdenum import ATP-binding protein modC|uniref:TOBE domain-containing protein n=1 Tax=Campylobacter concisus TaxID=199 RepID=A0A7S9NG72_9BACT|nr:TOBE domain-containing protein [Campylobacter concisus]QPH85185.1 TOBE domain-containing protein [Campylobacter concisus]QPH86952.1 TOBE domain-containing protein [Campylobacter concisus]